MKCKVFNFSRVHKTSRFIDEVLNEFLKDKVFGFAVQNESSQSGRVMLSVFYSNQTKANKSNCRVTSMRTQGHNELETQMNEVLEAIDGKPLLITQSFSANTITTIFFHGKNVKKEAQ
jgi:hypothetical protein